MRITTCPLDGVLIVEPKRYADERGYFFESYERERYLAAGMREEFVQDNKSRSARHVVRGLHFTKVKPQAQILTVMCGTIFDVVVDVRSGSPTKGRWFGTELTDSAVCQIYMPHGFAHGFCVLSDYADLHYKVSQRYDPGDEAGVRWNDPDIGIEWPIREPIVSARDQMHPLLRELDV